jgi:hypothetical protein
MLRPLPDDVQAIIVSADFQKHQREVNNLFGMSAMGAKRDDDQPMWNHDGGMLKLHGKPYHRAFDLGEPDPNDHFVNTARMYIYDGAGTRASRASEQTVADLVERLEPLLTRASF